MPSRVRFPIWTWHRYCPRSSSRTWRISRLTLPSRASLRMAVRPLYSGITPSSRSFPSRNTCTAWERSGCGDRSHVTAVGTVTGHRASGQGSSAVPPSGARWKLPVSPVRCGQKRDKGVWEGWERRSYAMDEGDVLGKGRAWEGHGRGLGEDWGVGGGLEVNARRNKAPLRLGLLPQTSRTREEVHKLLPDTRMGRQRNTSATRQPESQAPEELAISIRTRRTDTGRHQKGLVSLMRERGQWRRWGRRHEPHSKHSGIPQPSLATYLRGNS